MTAEQAKRLAQDWNTIAGETVTIEKIGGGIYGFCSELAALRLFHKYNIGAHCGASRAAYSENQKTWFFRLEVLFGDAA